MNPKRTGRNQQCNDYRKPLRLVSVGGDSPPGAGKAKTCGPNGTQVNAKEERKK